MSFPNPDNYARDCDCGTAGANTTPPPAAIQAEIDSLDTRVTALEETNDVIVSSGGIANLTTAQQALIREGSIVVTTDGRRWIYSGAGSKVLQASYIELSSLTIGSTANLPLITGTGGVIAAGTFGTTANTFCQGNDTRLSRPFAFRTQFATTAPSTSSDTRYFSTIDAVGATGAIELRNFELPYTYKFVACSATIYNTSASALASGGTVQYRLAVKATETSTSPTTTYALLTFTLPTIAGTGMASNYATIADNITISAGTDLAIQAVFTNLLGASLRGELTLYLL